MQRRKQVDKIKTLIVDNDPSYLDFLEKIVSARGHQVFKAIDAERALALFKKEFFNLVIINRMMPVKDGLEITREIRKLPESDLTVILINAAADIKDNLVHILLAGADDYISKSISRELLDLRLDIAENLLTSKLKRRHALYELQESEKRNRALIDDTPAAIFILSNDKIVYANNSACYLLGAKTSKELTKRFAADFFNTETLNTFQDKKNEYATKTYLTKVKEERLIRMDQSPVFALIRGIPFVYRKKPSVMLVAIDVTDKKKAEEKVKILSSAVEQSPNAVMITDTEGHIVYLNAAFTESLNLSEGTKIVHPEKDNFIKGKIKAKYLKILDKIQAGEKWNGEISTIGKGGKECWEFITTSPIQSDQGEVTHYLTITKDVTSEKEGRNALKESQERYALAEKGANDGLWDWKIHEEEIYFSPRWQEILGFKENELRPTLDEWFNRIHAEDINKFQEDLDAHLRGESDHFENESRMFHKDGSYRWILCRGVAITGNEEWPYRMSGSIMDITARISAEEKLLHDAFYDILTNLPNLKLFMDRLKGAVARGKRGEEYQFAVLFLDIDRMKNIVDSLGQDIGDLIIKETAKRLGNSVRIGDTVARYGGNAFVILLDNFKVQSEALVIVRRILQDLAETLYIQDHEFRITVSVGIAFNLSQEYEAEDILQFSHITVNKVKEQGGNSYLIYEKDMKIKALEKLSLENRLFKALKNNEFVLHYQPKIDVQSDEIYGFEALIRWQHPELGIIPPVQFIPLAESTGLIISIGKWILDESCKQILSWHKKWGKGLIISVNFSPRQFRQLDLFEMIEGILRTTGLDPKFLTIEITESTVMENIESSLKKLEQLKKLGLSFALDDFGTGYSSLSYLSQLPLDILKIDKSFIRGIPEQKDNIAITKTIIALANNLGLRVVAEGVEKNEQLNFLRQNGCHRIQGFYFYKPLPVAEIEKIFTGQLGKKVRKT